MEFKSLEMSGFKSFVDYTRITFSGGVTVVFGRKVAVKATLVASDMFYEGLLRAQANHVHRLF